MPKKIAEKGACAQFIFDHLGHDGDECLLWPYGKSNKGYGLAVINGKQKTASRWMCILAHGKPIGDRNEAAHNCGNPACVNPKHLRWATHKENMADRMLHGTENIGENNGKTRLTADDVRYIRSAPPHLEPLCKKFGMNKHGISKIRSGARWGHVV